jgi:hypothetical protein
LHLDQAVAGTVGINVVGAPFCAAVGGPPEFQRVGDAIVIEIDFQNGEGNLPRFPTTGKSEFPGFPLPPDT